MRRATTANNTRNAAVKKRSSATIGIKGIPHDEYISSSGRAVLTWLVAAALKRTGRATVAQLSSYCELKTDATTQALRKMRDVGSVRKIMSDDGVVMWELTGERKLPARKKFVKPVTHFGDLGGIKTASIWAYAAQVGA